MSTEAQADIIVRLLIFGGIAFVIFLVLREVMCWYWKINEMIAQNKQLIAQNRQIINILEAIGTNSSRLQHLDYLSDIAESLAPHKPQRTHDHTLYNRYD